MCFWRKMFARVSTAFWMRSCELPGAQGSLRMRFAKMSYCANASSSRFRAALASGVGRSCLLLYCVSTWQTGGGGREDQPEADHKLLEDRELLLDLFLEANEGL